MRKNDDGKPEVEPDATASLNGKAANSATDHLLTEGVAEAPICEIEILGTLHPTTTLDFKNASRSNYVADHLGESGKK